MAIHTVKKSGGDFSTLGSALASGDVGAGDTIEMYAGSYKEAIWIKKSNVTIKAHLNDHVEITGGVKLSYRSNPADNSGYFPNGVYTPNIATTDGCGYKWTPLVYIMGDNIVWDGIDVCESLGRGLQFYRDEVDAHGNHLFYNNIVVKNCVIHSNRGEAFQLGYLKNIHIENVEFHHNCNFYLGDNTSSSGNHPGTLSLKAAHGVEIFDCNFYYNGGEVICADSNNGGSSDVHIKRCTISDSKEVCLYMHAATKFVVEDSVFYASEDRDRWVNSDGNIIGFGGLAMQPVEKETIRLGGEVHGVEDVEIRNCLFVNTGRNISMGSQNPAGINNYYRNIKVSGCTFVQNKPHGNLIKHAPPVDERNNLIEGNIFYTSGPGEMISGSFNTNAYAFRKNIWISDPGSQYRTDSGSSIQDPQLVNPTAIIRQNAIDVNNYKLKPASPAINKWSGHGLSTDYFGGTRGDVSDYGFHDTQASVGGGMTPGDITVKKSGGDHNTIQKAVDAASSGDTIVVYAGEYKEAIHFNKNKSNITVKANAGDSVTVTGGMPFENKSNPTSGYLPTGSYREGSTNGARFKYEGLVVVEADDVTWQGIDIANGLGRGFRVGTNIENDPKRRVTIRDCVVYNHRNAGIIALFVYDFHVINVTMHHCTNYYLGDNVNQIGNWPGCSIYKGCRDVVIDNCDFYYNGGESVLIDANFFGSDGMTLKNSRISDAKSTVVYLHSTHNITVDNCVFYSSVDKDINKSGGVDKGYHGLQLTPIEEAGCNSNSPFTGIADVKIRNCLFVDMIINLWYTNRSKTCGGNAANLDVRGNTFVQTKSYSNLLAESYRVAENLTLEGNIFYTTDASKQANGAWSSAYKFKNNLWLHNPGTHLMGSGSIVGDPKLRNPGATIHRNNINLDNYKLLSDSPAINKWSGHGLSIDYFGGTRGAITDFGFHDTGSTGIPSIPTSPVASFVMSTHSVESGTEVVLTDTSTPSSGESIASRSFIVTLPGTSEKFQGASTTLSYTSCCSRKWGISRDI